MGAANPKAAAELVRNLTKKLGYEHIKIAYVTGDDVTNLIMNNDFPIPERPISTKDFSDSIISANAYLGASPIVQALRSGANIVITGRVADPALFLAPIIYEFNWSFDDYHLLGKGTMIGHLLECAGQITGGYFADPPKKTIANLAHLGFPYADIFNDGNCEISKVENSGGIITTQTCTEQLLYEIHDPKKYYTPDVIADFSAVYFEEKSKNHIYATGATGQAKPDNYKVSIGYKAGYIGEGQISYGGISAFERASLAIEILKERLSQYAFEDIRFDYIGANSLFPTSPNNTFNHPEIRIRVAARSTDISLAKLIGNEVEALYTNGPAGGGGAMKSIKPVVAVLSTFIPQDIITTNVTFI